MELKEIAIYLFGLVQALIIWNYKKDQSAHKLQLEIVARDAKKDLDLLERRVEKIEKEEFVEKIVKNTIFSPEFSAYFKNIVKDAVMSAEAHNSNNNKQILMHLNESLETIKEKLK